MQTALCHLVHLSNTSIISPCGGEALPASFGHSDVHLEQACQRHTTPQVLPDTRNWIGATTSSRSSMLLQAPGADGSADPVPGV